MAKPVFISHASEDAAIALQVCETLERQGIGCWIAPLDVRAGYSYLAQIMAAIESAVAVVLVLSENANKSTYVESEIERAFAKCRHIFPFRIQDVTPVPGLEFCIARIHWIEAWTPPREAPLQTLAEAIRAVVEPAPPEVPKPPERVPTVLPDPVPQVGTVFRDRFGDGGFGPQMGGAAGGGVPDGVARQRQPGL